MLENIPDKETENCLLPSWLAESSNSGEYKYRKLALNAAIEQCLSKYQRALIAEHYWAGKSKSRIAKEQGVAPSTIVKRLQSAEELLRDRVEFAVLVYKKQGEDSKDLFS